MTLFGLCNICGGDDLRGGEDGYFYCSACGSQSQQYQEQLLDYEALAGYSRRTQRSVAAATEGIEDTGEDPGPSLPTRQGPLFSSMGFADTSKPWETQSASRVPLHTAAKSLDPMETMDVDAASIRSIYIEGLQHIIQLQCETLVQNFHVSPLICGIVGPIWLRFVSCTRVLEKAWGKEVIQVEEAREERRKRRKKKKKKKKKETEQAHDEEEDMEDSPGIEVKTVQMRMALSFVWLGALKERIPLSVSLALIYLACHLAHEPILPTDIVQWAARGSLPYLAAFCEVEKKRYGLAWPIKARLMFKPIDVLGASKLEFMAASIATRIGLELPPVNFDAISHRFLKELNLPVEILSAYMHRFCEWYSPPELKLSDKAHALPSRVYVMAMVMIVLKVLYKIDGRLCTKTRVAGCGKAVGSPSDRKLHDNQPYFAAPSGRNHASDKVTLQKNDLPMVDGSYASAESLAEMQDSRDYFLETETKGVSDDMWSANYLLEKLEKSWQDHALQPFDYEKDLKPYLNYCQDTIFSGIKLQGEEESICERLWKLYEQPPKKVSSILQKEPSPPNIPEVQSLSGDSHFSFASLNGPGSCMEGATTAPEHGSLSTDKVALTGSDDIDNDDDNTGNIARSRSLEEILPDMESLGFTCLPPRKQPLMLDKYLRYVRKEAKDGNAQKVLHADYFMVLCACAKVIRVEPVALYWCVQRVENCLRPIEEKARDFSGGAMEEFHRQL